MITIQTYSTNDHFQDALHPRKWNFGDCSFSFVRILNTIENDGRLIGRMCSYATKINVLDLFPRNSMVSCGGGGTESHSKFVGGHYQYRTYNKNHSSCCPVVENFIFASKLSRCDRISSKSYVCVWRSDNHFKRLSTGSNRPQNGLDGK